MRKECWAEFDPFHLRYTNSTLPNALQNALEAGWAPALQLQNLPPPPLGLPGLYQCLGTADMLR